MAIHISDDSHFLRENVVDVNAAVIGIHRDRWKAVRTEEGMEEKARSIMLKYRFDILPVDTGGDIRWYFCTDKWNDFTRISQKEITYKDVIPSHTAVRDVIKGFASENRLFYFLTSEHRVVGLVSVVNLNCRQVSVYLFGLLSELETLLAELVGENLDEDQILEIVKSNKKQDVLNRYTDAKENGLDNPLLEFCYLSTLVNIVQKSGLYKLLRYSGKSFKNDLGSIVNLRNMADHPVRSIISDENSINALWQRIDRTEEALFKLRQTISRPQ